MPTENRQLTPDRIHAVLQELRLLGAEVENMERSCERSGFTELQSNFHEHGVKIVAEILKYQKMLEDNPEKPKMVDFGYANGWTEMPGVVRKCREAQHCIPHESIGRCLTKVTCVTCGYTYMIDSGD
jgi:hypothetical protein